MLRRRCTLAAVLAAALTGLCAASAQARIVPQRGIGGIELGMTVSQVRAHAGVPDAVAFRDDEIQGRVRVYRYGRTRVSFSPGSRARVNTVFTTDRRERTSAGVGVGSERGVVARRVPGARCRVEFGVDHCYVGSFRPGGTVTDFRIGGSGRVRSVTVGYVID